MLYGRNMLETWRKIHALHDNEKYVVHTNRHLPRKKRYNNIVAGPSAGSSDLVKFTEVRREL